MPRRSRSASGFSRERQRVESVYDAYAADPQKAAAWAGDNPGNRAIRAEVAGRIVPLVLASGGPVLDAGAARVGGFLAWRRRRGARSSHGRRPPARASGRRGGGGGGEDIGATVHSADVRALPFDDARFELALLLTVLSSLRDASDVRRAQGRADTARLVAGRKDTVAMVATIYVFSDEAGNFDFSGKTGASAFFVLCTVSAAHCQYGDQMLALRRRLAWRGQKLDSIFHATYDGYAVRAEVLNLLAGTTIRIDASLFNKDNVPDAPPRGALALPPRLGGASRAHHGHLGHADGPHC